jgi:hypothetical protein
MEYKGPFLGEFEERYFDFLIGACGIFNSLQIGSYNPIVASLLFTIGGVSIYLGARTTPLPERIQFRMPKCLESKVE